MSHPDPAAREIGAPPYPGGQAVWPTDPRLDPELLANGDARNVVDEFRYWHLEAIVAELDKRRNPLQIAIENLGHDFNIGSVVRTANAFNVSRAHVVGRRRWNRRGAMVTDRYLHLQHHENPAEFAASIDVPIIGIDNLPGSTPLEGAVLPRECVLVFGEESAGLSPEMLANCSSVHHITQYGSTRSINVGAAAAIAMYEWARQHMK